MYDVIIVGAGCAGLTAAVYALRAGKSVLILEAETIGGQISSSPKVENFPSIKSISGAEFSSNLFDQATELGADFELDRVEKVIDGETKKVITEYGEYECKALILATGVKHRKLDLENVDDYEGNGISYCAVCDGAFFKGMKVAVNGGGNSALQSAEMLSEICEKVYLIHRRDTFRGEKTHVERLEKIPNIEFVLNSTVTKLSGDGALECIEITNTQTNEKSTLEVSGLFAMIGQIPQNLVFADVVELDEAGYIKAGEDCKTSAKGIYAAGDCRTKSIRQLTTAAADGAVAALAAIN